MNIVERGIETSMVVLSQSLQHWLFENYPDKLVYIMLGHVEVLTSDIVNDYVKWLSTEEGKSWLEAKENI